MERASEHTGLELQEKRRKLFDQRERTELLSVLRLWWSLPPEVCGSFWKSLQVQGMSRAPGRSRPGRPRIQSIILTDGSGKVSGDTFQTFLVWQGDASDDPRALKCACPKFPDCWGHRRMPTSVGKTTTQSKTEHLGYGWRTSGSSWTILLRSPFGMMALGRKVGRRHLETHWGTWECLSVHRTSQLCQFCVSGKKEHVGIHGAHSKGNRSWSKPKRFLLSTDHHHWSNEWEAKHIETICISVDHSVERGVTTWEDMPKSASNDILHLLLAETPCMDHQFCTSNSQYCRILGTIMCTTCFEMPVADQTCCEQQKAGKIGHKIERNMWQKICDGWKQLRIVNLGCAGKHFSQGTARWSVMRILMGCAKSKPQR